MRRVHMLFILIGFALIATIKSQGYKVTCSNDLKKQSPINIQTYGYRKSERMESSKWKPVGLIFQKRVPVFSKDKKLIFVNNDRFLNVSVDDPEDDPLLVLDAPGLSNLYRLKEIHFHYGCESRRGSEHQIDGKKYPLEVQFVFWNDKKYSTFEEATKDENHEGLAIVSSLFEFESGNREKGFAFKVMASAQTQKRYLYTGPYGTVGDLEYSTMGADVFQFITGLLPEGRNENSQYDSRKYNVFFTYDGSLTSPECNESVKWFVLLTHRKVNEQEVSSLRFYKSSQVNPDGPYEGKLCDNFREIQPTGDRIVYF